MDADENVDIEEVLNEWLPLSIMFANIMNSFSIVRLVAIGASCNNEDGMAVAVIAIFVHIPFSSSTSKPHPIILTNHERRASLHFFAFESRAEKRRLFGYYVCERWI